MPYTINPNDIDIVMNALERHLDNCYTYKYQDGGDGWKGRNGCLCSQCWEFHKKGTYKQWLKLHKKVIREQDKFTKIFRENMNK